MKMMILESLKAVRLSATKTLMAATAAVGLILPSLADMPTAIVTKLDADALAAWNNENDGKGLKIYEFSKALESGTTSEGVIGVLKQVCYYRSDVGYRFDMDPHDTASEYAGWWADYAVSFDRPVAKNSLGLVGRYEKWDNGISLGFLSPLEVPTGYKIPLLNSVMRNQNWTYGNIRENVGSFTCGAFNLSAENIGTTMTVELRLFDPGVFTSTEAVCDSSLWKDGVNSFVIKRIEYTFTKQGAIRVGAGDSAEDYFACSGIANGASGAAVTIPVGQYYINPDDATFVQSTGNYSVSQKTVYFDHPKYVIGLDGYASMSDAFAAAKDGDTIIMGANCSETFTADSAKAFTINTNGHAFAAANITPRENCELVENLDGTWSYRMKVTISDQITKNVVETKITDETDSAAVAITDENIGLLFPTEGAKTLEIVASGVGTVSFDPEAVTKIGQNITNVIVQAGGLETGATAKTTVTVAIADVTEEVKEQPETPTVIVESNETFEVVQAISVTAILKTIVKQEGSETAVTNEEVYADGKAAGISTVTIPYSGIRPQVWFVNTEKTPWETNKMTTAYNADAKLLSFDVFHFSDYVITDAETYAKVGTEKFRTLQEAFDWVATNDTQGTTIVLTKDNVLETPAALAAGTTATLNLNGKKITGSLANSGTLTITGSGTVDAGSAVFVTAGADVAKTYIQNGIFKGAFPDATGLATNAGPILASGGKFQAQVPWAFCAQGYEPNPDQTADHYYTVKDANVFIHPLGACQRYPWNGYVDVEVDVCWGTVGTARLFVSVWDTTNPTNWVQLTKMKNATLFEDGVSKGNVDCEEGFVVTTPTDPVGKKRLHLIWNSTEAVPEGTKKEKIGFKFTAK